MFNERKQTLVDTSGYCQRCACAAHAWFAWQFASSMMPNCVSRVARIKINFSVYKKKIHVETPIKCKMYFCLQSITVWTSICFPIEMTTVPCVRLCYNPGVGCAHWDYIIIGSCLASNAWTWTLKHTGFFFLQCLDQIICSLTTHTLCTHTWRRPCMDKCITIYNVPQT